MKLGQSLKKKLLGNLQTDHISDDHNNGHQYYVEGWQEEGYIRSFHPLQNNTQKRWGCFPLRRRRTQGSPVLVEPPTYEEALQLDENNPMRVVRDSVMRNFPKGRPEGKTAREGCMICLYPFEKPVEIPCKHIFCRECINEWLSRQHTCPICRYEFSEKQTKMLNLK